MFYFASSKADLFCYFLHSSGASTGFSPPPFGGGGLGLSFGISFYLTRSVRTAFSSHKK